MTQIFISHAHEDSPCAEQIRHDLEAEGYVVWKDAQSLPPGSASYPRAIANGIRGSAAVVVVWSASAAPSEWVEREVLVAQRLRKPIFPVMTDDTDLPITLVNVQAIRSPAPCTDAVSHLRPHLPAPSADELFDALLAELSHEYIRVRQEGIARAEELARKEPYGEQVLALLEDLAHNDLIGIVRDDARAALDRLNPQPPAGLPGSPDSRHIFGARCRNGHVSYFDRREVCPASGSVIRRRTVMRGGAEIDELILKCRECGEELTAHVDCAGYK